MATIHLGRLLGASGFARTVAIKRMHPQYAKDEEFSAMFADEARMAARIQHPNVVAMLDVVLEAGELLLVMDYVHGEPLSRLVRASSREGRDIPPGIAATVMAQALHGLHAAHTAKGADGRALDLVHRDVSPQNILVGLDGTTRITDFGIAKALGRSHTTRDGSVRGKLAYMAPEQLAGTVDASGSLHFVGPLDATSLFPYAPPDPSGAYLVGATQLHDPNGVPLQGLPSSGEVTAVAYDPEYDRLAIARKDHLVLTRARASTTFLDAAEIPLPPEVTVAQLRFDTFGTLWMAGTATGDFVFSGASVGLGGAQAGAFLLRLQPDDDNTVEDPVEVLRVFGAKAGSVESSLVVRDLELSSSEVFLLVTARMGRLDLPAQPDPAPDDLGGSYLLRCGCF
jgi:hypothetical protein